MAEELNDDKIELNYNDINTIVNNKEVKELCELLSTSILCGIENISKYNKVVLGQKEPRINPKYFYTYEDDFSHATSDKVEKPLPFTIGTKCKSFMAFLLSLYINSEIDDDQKDTNTIKHIIEEIVEKNDISTIQEYKYITSFDAINKAINSIKHDDIVTLMGQLHVKDPVKSEQIRLRVNETFLKFIKILSYSLADKVYNNGERVTIYKTPKPRAPKPKKATTTPKKATTPKEPKYKEGDQVHKGFSLTIDDFYEAIHRLIPVASNNSRNFSYYVTVFTEVLENRVILEHKTSTGSTIKETTQKWDFIDLFDEYRTSRNPSKTPKASSTPLTVPSTEDIAENK